MANLVRKGFRWVGSKYAPGNPVPPIQLIPVADDYATKLALGDPVKLVSTGYLERAATNDNVIGVFDGMHQYFDGSVIRQGPHYPASTSYDTNFERVSIARVITAKGQLFEGTCDDATTATTYAAYLALRGENVDFVVAASVGDHSSSQIDISTHATTAEDLRIEDVPDRNFQEFDAANVRLIVSFNLVLEGGAGSTTGV